MEDPWNEVTDDITNELTTDLARARHISDLIVNCCQMNSARNFMNELAFVVAFRFSSGSCSIPDLTGSCAELYIDPGDTCIGDIDLMFPEKHTIVMCDGSVIVDSIDVDETIDVYKIETSDCPNGYVHLRSFCKLQFNLETEQFEYRVSNHTGKYLRVSFSDHDADVSMVQPELKKIMCLIRRTLISCKLYVFSLGLQWRNLGYRGKEINHGHQMRSYPRYNGMGAI